MYWRQMLVAISLTSPVPLIARLSISQSSMQAPVALPPLPLETPKHPAASSPSTLLTPADPLQLLKSLFREAYLDVDESQQS